ERLAQKRQHLGAIALRPDEIGFGLNRVDQRLLILAHAKKIIFLADEIGHGLVIGALAVHQLFFRVKALTAVAVKAAVLAEVDFAGVVDFLQHLAHVVLMIAVGGADEMIVGDAAAIPGGAEKRADAVGVF